MMKSKLKNILENTRIYIQENIEKCNTLKYFRNVNEDTTVTCKTF